MKKTGVGENVGVQLEPYIHPSQWSCPQCGTDVTWLERLVARLKLTVAGAGRIFYCSGGKEAVEKEIGVAEVLATGKTERVNNCAGVLEPHLHVRCGGCGYQELRRTKAGRL